MATIRRLKTGNSGHVTPSEFRLVLIKFGISIPQDLVESIFNLFDSDGSGTIDFDEFAMWIMNSEFRPVNKDTKATKVDPKELVRIKLRDCLKKYPEVFETMKKRISFLDLVSDISRKDMELTEKEGRFIFQILDPGNVGLIESAKLKRFALDGVTETPPVSAKPFVKPDLNEAVFKICGKHTNLLLDCFTHYDTSAELEYDEFKRALLSNNLGLNPKDAKNLFLALGGRYGRCKLSILKSNIQPMAIDPACEAAIKTKAPSHIPQSRAERRLRDAIRKSYSSLRRTFEMCDRDGSGFINPTLFCKILNGVVLPINYEDFRFMMRHTESNSDGSFNYHHFLALFDPTQAPHELSGSRSAASLGDLKMSALKSSNQQGGSPPGSSGGMAPSASAGALTSTAGGGESGRANNELKRMWQSALRTCKAQDTDKSGFVSRSVFVDALEMHLGKVMDSSRFASLANSYAIGDDVDYHTCFRACLNNVMNGNTSTSKSKFQMAPISKSRQVRQSHPWQFQYTSSAETINGEIPYWKRACTQPRSRPTTTQHAVSMDSGTYGFNKTAPGSLNLQDYEPKVISTANKVANHPNYRTFKSELKRAQLTNHKGCCSSSNFYAILNLAEIKLSKSESGTVMRVFRSRGMADTVNYKDFIDVCEVAKNIDM